VLSKSAYKIKIGIIGLGKMGGYHLSALKSLCEGEFESYYKGDSVDILSKLEICGVCDLAVDRKLPLDDVPFFSDYRKLICFTDPDMVVITTPTQSHFEIAKFALKNKVNVFVEQTLP